MKEKVFKLNLELSDMKIKQIKDFFKGEISIFSYDKLIEIPDGDDIHKLHIMLFEENNYLRLRVKMSSTTRPRFTVNTEENVCKSIDEIIGIRSYEYYTYPNGKLKFYININKYFPEEQMYSKEYYEDKFENFYEKTFKNHVAIEKFSNIYSEVVCADFTKEREVAFATFCILSYPEKILHDKGVLKLYKDKLEYIGVELGYITNPLLRTGHDKDYLIDELKKLSTSKEIYDFMLTYIDLIDYFAESNPKFFDSKFISEFACDLYKKYLSLLE